MNTPRDMQVLEKLTEILDKLKISYAIGGSMASSVYGVVRFTQDADINIDLILPVVEGFYEAVRDDFYVDRDTMYNAVHNKNSFNIIHFETAFKIDLFVGSKDEFHSQIFSHSKKLQLSDRSTTFNFVSPEDIILLKLDWYRQSGCISERQWSDVMGVLMAQSKSLNYCYMREWAAKLMVEDLLQQALDQMKKKNL
jgi:hypothetical protein